MTDSPDRQAILGDLQKAVTALEKRELASALEILRELDAETFPAEGLGETIASLENNGPASAEIARQWTERTITTLSTLDAKEEDNKFQLPRPATLSKSGPESLSRREEHSKETRRLPALTKSDALRGRSASLSERLREVLKKESPPDFEVEEVEEINFDLGLITPEEAFPQADFEGFDFDLDSDQTAPAKETAPHEDSRFPKQANLDTPFPPENIARQAPRRMRQETPLVSSVDLNDFATFGQKPSSSSQKAPFLAGTSEPGSDFEGPSTPTQVLAKNSPVDEEEFFALAESLASEVSDPNSSESESKSSYRGEPLIKELADEPTPARIDESGESANPFAHNAPTGVRNKALAPEDTSARTDQTDARIGSVTNQGAESTLDQARSLYESGELQGALDLVKALLSKVQDSEAIAFQALLERELERVQRQRIGALGRIPSVAVDMSTFAKLDLDHRAGFILSQIDGMLCFEDIIDMSSMSRLETMTLLAELCDQGIIVAQ